MLRRILLGLAVGGLLMLTCGCGECPKLPEKLTLSTSDADETGEASAVDLKALYEEVKASGAHVPDDVMEWAKTDVKKIGAWDYCILTIGDASETAIQDKLRELGEQRWECFWVEPTSEGNRFYFKKAQRSYIQMAGKASKLIPTPNSGD